MQPLYRVCIMDVFGRYPVPKRFETCFVGTLHHFPKVFESSSLIGSMFRKYRYNLQSPKRKTTQPQPHLHHGATIKLTSSFPHLDQRQAMEIPMSHPLDQFVNFESPTARGVLHKILEGGSTARKRQNVGETKVAF